jgi:hypothetical protein
MKEYARAFYKSAAWRHVSQAYMASRNYICERCGGVAVICHHKHYLTPANIQDPDVALNWNNLEALCQDCHNKEHFEQKGGNECLFDSSGNVLGVKETAEVKQYKRETNQVDAMLSELRQKAAEGL